MTTPNERTRALRLGAEMLRDLAGHGQTRSKDREAAETILRTFPGPNAVSTWIKDGARVLPAEDAHAVEAAGDLLRAVQHPGRCPEDLRAQLGVTLRHYPDAWGVQRWGDPRLS